MTPLRELQAQWDQALQDIRLFGAKSEKGKRARRLMTSLRPKFAAHTRQVLADLEIVKAREIEALPPFTPERTPPLLLPMGEDDTPRSAHERALLEYPNYEMEKQL